MGNITKKIVTTVKNGIISGVQGTFSTTHIGLAYASIVCEMAEASFIKRTTGQDPDEVRFERKLRTEATIKDHSNMVKTIKDDFNARVENRFGTQQDVVVETALHNS